MHSSYVSEVFVPPECIVCLIVWAETLASQCSFAALFPFFWLFHHNKKIWNRNKQLKRGLMLQWNDLVYVLGKFDVEVNVLR